MTPRIVVPTYDEADTIVPLLAALRGHLGAAVRILVVDDSSPDGTAARVRAAMAGDPALELLTRPAKLGLASAYQTALRRILDEGREDCVVTMDADFSHDPRYVPGLIAAAASHDLVIGSRYASGGGVDKWSLRRRLILPLAVIALAGVAIHAVVDFPFQIYSIQLYVATYLGVCWGSALWR